MMMTTVKFSGVDDGVRLRPPLFLHFPVKCSLLVATASVPTGRTRSTSALHASDTSRAFGAFHRAGDEQKLEGGDDSIIKKRKRRVFFLDVNPLCYDGKTPSLRSFGYWISLFLSRVAIEDPVVAVMDGERGSEPRRLLLPSYKANRVRFTRPASANQPWGSSRLHQVVNDVLRGCDIPVVQIEGQEADDVIASLAEQALGRGYRVVIASPDKDFKQMISEEIQIVMPMTDLGRWSFYTLKHYIAQYDCDPHSDLSLRCILGDEVDGVPGIQHLAPAFGRKTALKLLKKHGSLENLLNAAAVRTVGKPYAQDALTKYADYLRRNYEVLALRRNLDVHLQEECIVAVSSAHVTSIRTDDYRKTKRVLGLKPQGHIDMC
ncbi:hypothetical protein MLD38_000331 [Melastoma candidum]|uniref:Uncharacterized protein n=1 Tax=Melastoma candidum TaxID=119954 RepID=A0ACB9SEN0_9MYRT|nr:hypothetical protein MLD38_000331 [Melastoma candidum]